MAKKENDGEAGKRRGGKGHLSAWESHQSDRALAKKQRTKGKQGSTIETSLDMDQNFLISREEITGEYAVVASNQTGRLTVLQAGAMLEARLSPDVSFEWSKAIVVGDHVTLKHAYERWQIDHLVERRSSLTRLRKDSTRWGNGNAEEHVIAANVDKAVIVAAAKNPPFHPKFIDRYLILVRHGGIEPIICLNKADLLEPNEKFDILNYYQELGIPVIFTSTETQQGIDELKELIRNGSSVLVGHSGVGKSSLINSLIPEAQIRVGDVSARGGKGRHTTTSSELLQWDANSLIIDTPGVRSLGMWDIHRSDLQLYFDEIAEHAVECKFNDCLHVQVESRMCGVLRAVEVGVIPAARYESYRKILEELSD